MFLVVDCGGVAFHFPSNWRKVVLYLLPSLQTKTSGPHNIKGYWAAGRVVDWVGDAQWRDGHDLARAVSRASRFFPASRNSFDQL